MMTLPAKSRVGVQTQKWSLCYFMKCKSPQIICKLFVDLT
jgi:hypothetical protein